MQNDTCATTESCGNRKSKLPVPVGGVSMYGDLVGSTLMLVDQTSQDSFNEIARHITSLRASPARLEELLDRILHLALNARDDINAMAEVVGCNFKT